MEVKFDSSLSGGLEPLETYTPVSFRRGVGAECSNRIRSMAIVMASVQHATKHNLCNHRLRDQRKSTPLHSLPLSIKALQLGFSVGRGRSDTSIWGGGIGAQLFLRAGMSHASFTC
eukprot:1160300-Amphidinium_carterae.1